MEKTEETAKLKVEQHLYINRLAIGDNLKNPLAVRFILNRGVFE